MNKIQGMKNGEFEMVTRHLVMEKDLNAFGNLFGGTMLSWLDESSALYVMEKIGYANFVTVNMDDVNFRTPSHRGDAIILYSKIIRIGRASITVQTKAFIHEPETCKKQELITCMVTFVCLKNSRPYAYFRSDAYKAWLQMKKTDPDRCDP